MAEINGNNKTGLIGVIIQAGAVGLALVSMWIVYNLVSNHMVHNTEATNNNTQVLMELKGAIETLNSNNVTQAAMMGDIKNLIIQTRK